MMLKPLEMPIVVVFRDAIIYSGSTTIMPFSPINFVPLTMFKSDYCYGINEKSF